MLGPNGFCLEAGGGGTKEASLGAAYKTLEDLALSGVVNDIPLVLPVSSWVSPETALNFRLFETLRRLRNPTEPSQWDKSQSLAHL